MARGGGPERVDRLHRAGDGGREADAIVGAMNIIVHRLGDRDDIPAKARQMRGKTQGAVAAESDQRVDLQCIQHIEHLLGLVALRCHPGIAARAVQHRAALPVDAAHPVAVEHHHAVLRRPGIGGINPQHAFPAAPQANHIPAALPCRRRDRLDTGIEAGNIAAAGEDCQTHFILPVSAAALPTHFGGASGAANQGPSLPQSLSLSKDQS